MECGGEAGLFVVAGGLFEETDLLAFAGLFEFEFALAGLFELELVFVGLLELELAFAGLFDPLFVFVLDIAAVFDFAAALGGRSVFAVFAAG